MTDDPGNYKRLAAAVMLAAVQDAKAGDFEAACWLASAEVSNLWADAVGILPDAVMALAAPLVLTPATETTTKKRPGRRALEKEYS